MLAGAPSPVLAPSASPRAHAKGAICPHCDAPSELGATLCAYCGATLGEPPRRSGMTQRAMALDAEAARLALETRPSKPAIVVRKQPRAATWWERAFVLFTFGLGWLWVRRRLS